MHIFAPVSWSTLLALLPQTLIFPLIKIPILIKCPHKLACGRAGLGCKSSVRYFPLGLTRVSHTLVSFSHSFDACDGWVFSFSSELEGHSV